MIIELGGVVPKDLLGAGQGDVSAGTPSKTDLAEHSGLHDAHAMAATLATDDDGGVHHAVTMETGTDGDGLYGKLEDAMVERLEQAVQDAEDEADFRKDE